MSTRTFWIRRNEHVSSDGYAMYRSKGAMLNDQPFATTNTHNPFSPVDFFIEPGAAARVTVTVEIRSRIQRSNDDQ